MRGVKTFRNLFGYEEIKEKPASVPTQQQRKEEAMCFFYYYFGRKAIITQGKQIRMSYSSLLALLSQAFFLESATVTDIIQRNSSRIAAIKTDWRDSDDEALLAYLREKWPLINW